jgi:hypothetical protein
MSRLRTDIRVRAEGSGLIIKPIVIILALSYDTLFGSPEGHLALVAFALGQLAYAATLFYVYRSRYKGVSLLPKRVRKSSRFLRFVSYNRKRKGATLTSNLFCATAIILNPILFGYL